jgi:hypothetical protein
MNTKSIDDRKLAPGARPKTASQPDLTTNELPWRHRADRRLACQLRYPRAASSPSWDQPGLPKMIGTATNSSPTKATGGSHAHFCATTKPLSRLTPTPSTTTPMNHLIKRSGWRAGTPQELGSATPHSLEQPTHRGTTSARRVNNPTGGWQDPPTSGRAAMGASSPGHVFDLELRGHRGVRRHG